MSQNSESSSSSPKPSLKTKGHKTYKLSFLHKALLFIIILGVKLWSLTLRYEQSSQIPLPKLKSNPKPYFILFWHNRLFLAIKFYSSFWKPRKVYGLTSPSKDGAWVSGVLDFLGVGSIRGSTSKLGAQANQEILDVIKEKNADIVITPDGPRGPKYSVRTTLINTFGKVDNPILLISAEYQSAWRLKNWDQFFLPKPFSKVILRGTFYENYEALKHTASTLNISPEDLVKRDLSKGCPADNN